MAWDAVPGSRMLCLAPQSHEAGQVCGEGPVGEIEAGAPEIKATIARCTTDSPLTLGKALLISKTQFPNCKMETATLP